jgi:alanyl-tRNA synthetase
VLSGEVAWRLYDTYGFPVDLTELMADELHLKIDKAGFVAAEKASKEASKATKAEGGEKIILDVHLLSELQSKSVPRTDDQAKYEYSRDNSGVYTYPSVKATVVALVHNKALVESVPASTQCGVVLSSTNMYAESGGQEADVGFLAWGASEEEQDRQQFKVEDVQVFNGYVLHIGETTAALAVGTQVEVSVNGERRDPIMFNHTATHLLNYALREHLGTGVDQKGSLVAEDRLRFDFSHNAPVTTEELKKCDETVSQFIRDNLAVYKLPATLATALAVNGLRAVFGEVYPDPVRVVSVGVDVAKLLENPQNPEWAKTSVEFCGGTHVLATGDIGQFTIIEETATARGVRRIVAVTNKAAVSALHRGKELETEVAKLDSLSPQEVGAAATELLDKVNGSVIPAWLKAHLRDVLMTHKKRCADWERDAKARALTDATARIEALVKGLGEDVQFVAELVELGSDRKGLNTLVQVINPKKGGVARAGLLVTADAGKEIVVMASVPPALTSKLNAREWVESVQDLLKGKGGGNDQTAQLTGTATEHAVEALQIATAFARSKLA